MEALGGVLEVLGGILEALGSVLEALGSVLEAMPSQDKLEKAQDAKTLETTKVNERSGGERSDKALPCASKLSRSPIPSRASRSFATTGL